MEKDMVLTKGDFKSIFDGFVKQGRVTHLKTPLTIHLELTFRCNSKCIMCYDESAPTVHSKMEMSTEEVKGILDECQKLNVFQITFGGGEPLLREDVFELLEYAKEKGFTILFITNGILLTEERTRRLNEILDWRFDKIQVSVDGSNVEIHDKQRGIDGIFEKTLEGIGNLNRYNIPYTMNTVATKLNFKDIPNILKLAIDKKAQTYRIMRLHPLGRASDPQFFRELSLDFAQQSALYEFIERKRDEFRGTGIINITTENACVFPLNHKSIRNQLGSRKEDVKSLACSAGTSTLAIGPDGYVVPCSFLHTYPELRVGNVREESLESIWRKRLEFEEYRDMKEKDGKCSDCNYLAQCKGGCRALSYSVHGNMSSPDPICNLYEDERIFDI